MAWKQSKVNRRLFHIGRYSLSTKFSLKNTDDKFIITNIYGPYNRPFHLSFLQELKKLSSSIHLPWTLIGDFNASRFKIERSGASESSCSSHELNNFINTLALIEINPTSHRFTWSNLWGQPSLAKLDRYFVTMNWHAAFPSSSLSPLPRVTSDHIPLLL